MKNFCGMVIIGALLSLFYEGGAASSSTDTKNHRLFMEQKAMLSILDEKGQECTELTADILLTELNLQEGDVMKILEATPKEKRGYLKTVIQNRNRNAKLMALARSMARFSNNVLLGIEQHEGGMIEVMTGKYDERIKREIVIIQPYQGSCLNFHL